ncbi:transcriptional regulator [Salmonella bongori serovar 40:z35:- str. 95-0123]|nr:transcriptional regulator [Salmonella bongori serovar 40:z35:- str. 95-0123]EGE4658622.1 transcriptional regulator [Salmonella bongori serovar 48:i:- str. 94-0708]
MPQQRSSSPPRSHFDNTYCHIDNKNNSHFDYQNNQKRK